MQVGNGQLSIGMERSHFALWAVLKAPLLIGTDLRALRPESLAILKARPALPTPAQGSIAIGGSHWLTLLIAIRRRRQRCWL